jgi:ATP-dependent DNA ligase
VCSQCNSTIDQANNSSDPNGRNEPIQILAGCAFDDELGLETNTDGVDFFVSRQYQYQTASEVGVSLVGVSQWWSGYTLTGKRETIEKLKKFLAEERSSLTPLPKKFFPEFVIPMTASVAKKPFNSPDWIVETKLDGYRAIAVIDSAGKARFGPVTGCRSNRSARWSKRRSIN